MAEHAQVDFDALQMEYAQQLINEEYIGAPPRNTQRMEHTLHPDVETGDLGNIMICLESMDWAQDTVVESEVR